MFSFQAMKDGTDWSPRFIVFGDLGVENAMSLKNMQKDAFTGLVDAVLHVGQCCTLALYPHDKLKFLETEFTK